LHLGESENLSAEALAVMLAASGRDRGNVSLGDPSGMLKVVDLLVRGAKIL